MYSTPQVLRYLVVVALRRAAVHLVILHQSLGQSDSLQQILDEALDSNFTAGLLSSRRLKELLDGYHLPEKQQYVCFSCRCWQVMSQHGRQPFAHAWWCFRDQLCRWN